jgi:hypothetical protein
METIKEQLGVLVMSRSVGDGEAASAVASTSKHLTPRLAASSLLNEWRCKAFELVMTFYIYDNASALTQQIFSRSLGHWPENQHSGTQFTNMNTPESRVWKTRN